MFMVVTIAAILLTTVSGLAQDSTPEDTCESSPAIVATPALECAEIFGDESNLEANRERRHEALEWVIQMSPRVASTDSSAWTEPEPIHFANLSIVQTESSDECEPIVVVELDNESDSIPCDADLFAVGGDASLGPDIRILAILDDLILVEHENRLAYVLGPDAPQPSFRMVWHAPFSIKQPVSKSASSGRSPRKRTTSRKRR